MWHLFLMNSTGEAVNWEIISKTHTFSKGWEIDVWWNDKSSQFVLFFCSGMFVTLPEWGGYFSLVYTVLSPWN